MASNTREIRLKVLYAHDPGYTVLFYTAVKIAGVFCRIGCPARAPTPENVLLFDTVKEALDAGFRPCKVCEPIERGDDVPDVMREILRELHAHPQTRIKDSELP